MHNIRAKLALFRIPFKFRCLLILAALLLFPLILDSAVSFAKASESKAHFPGGSIKNLDPNQFNLPSNLGRLSVLASSKDQYLKNKPLILYIDEDRLIPENQQNIFDTLQFLTTNFSGKVLILAEGGEGAVEPMIWGTIPELKITRDLLQREILSGELTGAEALYMISREDIDFKGWEKQELYDANIRTRSQLKLTQGMFLRAVSRIEQALEIMKQKVWSRDLRLFDVQLNNYESKRIRTAMYLNQIKSWVASSGISLSAFPSIRDYYEQSEWKKLFEEQPLNELVLRFIWRYQDQIKPFLDKSDRFEYKWQRERFDIGSLEPHIFAWYLIQKCLDLGFDLEGFEELQLALDRTADVRVSDPNALAFEMTGFNVSLIKQLVKNKKERQLLDAIQDIDSLKQLVRQEASSERVRSYFLNKEEYQAKRFVEYVKKDYPSGRVDWSLEPLEAYYRDVLRRDNQLKEQLKSEIELEKYDVIFVIAGPFHKTKIMELALERSLKVLGLNSLGDLSATEDHTDRRLVERLNRTGALSAPLVLTDSGALERKQKQLEEALSRKIIHEMGGDWLDIEPLFATWWQNIKKGKNAQETRFVSLRKRTWQLCRPENSPEAWDRIFDLRMTIQDFQAQADDWSRESLEAILEKVAQFYLTVPVVASGDPEFSETYKRWMIDIENQRHYFEQQLEYFSAHQWKSIKPVMSSTDVSPTIQGDEGKSQNQATFVYGFRERRVEMQRQKAKMAQERESLRLFSELKVDTEKLLNEIVRLENADGSFTNGNELAIMDAHLRLQWMRLSRKWSQLNSFTKGDLDARSRLWLREFEDLDQRLGKLEAEQALQLNELSSIEHAQNQHKKIAATETPELPLFKETQIESLPQLVRAGERIQNETIHKVIDTPAVVEVVAPRDLILEENAQKAIQVIRDARQSLSYLMLDSEAREFSTLADEFVNLADRTAIFAEHFISNKGQPKYEDLLMMEREFEYQWGQWLLDLKEAENNMNARDHKEKDKFNRDLRQEVNRLESHVQTVKQRLGTMNQEMKKDRMTNIEGWMKAINEMGDEVTVISREFFNLPAVDETSSLVTSIQELKQGLRLAQLVLEKEANNQRKVREINVSLKNIVEDYRMGIEDLRRQQTQISGEDTGNMEQMIRAINSYMLDLKNARDYLLKNFSSSQMDESEPQLQAFMRQSEVLKGDVEIQMIAAHRANEVTKLDVDMLAITAELYQMEQNWKTLQDDERTLSMLSPLNAKIQNIREQLETLSQDGGALALPFDFRSRAWHLQTQFQDLQRNIQSSIQESKLRARAEHDAWMIMEALSDLDHDLRDMIDLKPLQDRNELDRRRERKQKIESKVQELTLNYSQQLSPELILSINGKREEVRLSVFELQKDLDQLETQIESYEKDRASDYEVVDALSKNLSDELSRLSILRASLLDYDLEILNDLYGTALNRYQQLDSKMFMVQSNVSERHKDLWDEFFQSALYRTYVKSREEVRVVAHELMTERDMRDATLSFGYDLFDRLEKTLTEVTQGVILQEQAQKAIAQYEEALETLRGDARWPRSIAQIEEMEDKLNLIRDSAEGVLL